MSEIDRRKLGKKALALLERCDALVNFYKANNPDAARIALYPKDFLLLANALERSKQDINTATYRGFRLIKAKT